jgi:hypothetical protein
MSWREGIQQGVIHRIDRPHLKVTLVVGPVIVGSDRIPTTYIRLLVGDRAPIVAKRLALDQGIAGDRRRADIAGAYRASAPTPLITAAEEERRE